MVFPFPFPFRLPAPWAFPRPLVPAGLAVLRYDENMDWEERYYLVKAEETPADEAPGTVVKGKPAEEKPAEVTPADVHPREAPGLSEI